MPRIISILSVYKQITALIIAVGTSIILLSVSPQDQIRLSRMTAVTVLTPVQDLFSYIPAFFGLRKENRLLRKELVQLQLKNANMQESLLENDRLRSLLDLKKQSRFSYISSEVIARDTGRGFNTVIINTGRQDHVKRYMAVVTTEGVLGRVIEVGPTSSVVQLLTDRNCRISGVVQRSREQGTVSWQLNTQLDLRLPLRADIRMGDRIVTSGLGGTFPPGLTIGRVSHIVLEDRGLFKRASITPIVDLNRLEEVFIIEGDTQRSPDRNWRDQPLSNSDRQ